MSERDSACSTEHVDLPQRVAAVGFEILEVAVGDGYHHFLALRR